MLSEKLCKMFSHFNVNSNNKNDEIHDIFKRSSASLNNRNDNYVER